MLTNKLGFASLADRKPNKWSLTQGIIFAIFVVCRKSLAPNRFLLNLPEIIVDIGGEKVNLTRNKKIYMPFFFNSWYNVCYRDSSWITLVGTFIESKSIITMQELTNEEIGQELGGN